MSRHQLARWAFWALATAITVLSLTPVEHLPPQVFDWWDKAQHALGFALLTITARLAYPAAPGNSLWVGRLLQGGGHRAEPSRQWLAPR